MNAATRRIVESWKARNRRSKASSARSYADGFASAIKPRRYRSVRSKYRRRAYKRRTRAFKRGRRAGKRLRRLRKYRFIRRWTRSGN